MKHLMGTVVKYTNVHNTTKFPLEKQNWTRLRREITPIKHRTLCLPEILELEAVSKNTKVSRWAGNNSRTPCNRTTQFTLCLLVL